MDKYDVVKVTTFYDGSTNRMQEHTFASLSDAVACASAMNLSTHDRNVCWVVTQIISEP